MDVILVCKYGGRLQVIKPKEPAAAAAAVAAAVVVNYCIGLTQKDTSSM